MPINLRALPHKSRSQSMQDIFAYNVVGENGTYVEIGAYKPEHKNNTYVLETKLGYRGFSIEHNVRWQPMWQECQQRRNPIFWEDALTFDYAAKCQRTIEQGLSFDCVTFEHDRLSPKSARYQHHNIEQQANDFMEAHGYQVAVYDVWAGGDESCIIETWYVNQDIDYPCLSYRAWQQQYLNIQQGKL